MALQFCRGLLAMTLIEGETMAFRKRREALRSILSGSACIRPGSVYDATSIRIAEDLGFELGMCGGSVASLAVLGDPDIALITLTELAEQMRRMSRASALPVLVDADHGYGNALNVRRTVQELEAAGAAGLTIEDTLLPQAFCEAKTQLISLEEGVGKMKAALDGRSDPSLVIVGRTGAVSITNLDDAIVRARAYETVGVDALFFTGIKARAELEAIAAATTLPIVLGGAPEEMTALDYLAGQRVRIALQGHAPFAAATQAVYETLKALREGASPKTLKGIASSELTGRVMREAETKARAGEFLGLKK
jgi:oxaloacetate decarboxylase